MADGAPLVVEHFDEIVRTLRVGYRPGTNEACETCVISPEQLAEMLRDLLRDHDPAIRKVEVDALPD